MTITIVGLGPGDARHLTREAWEVLAAADEVWLRTARHPTVAGLPDTAAVRSFDPLYQSAREFADVYRAIASEVVRLGQRPQGVIYAVPGHPLVGEATVQHVLAQAGQESLAVRVVEGLSFIEPTLTALGLDALEGLQICDGIELAARHHPPLNPDLPALVGQVYSRPLASDLKLTLMNQYPDEHPIALVHGAGTAEETVIHLPLYELDRHEVAHLSSLYISALPPVHSFEGFQETVAHLRAPDGCPWDREQTYESLRTNLLEEAYEAVAAIDAGDIAKLQEELGDMLLQVDLQAQIASEEGDFRMIDVIAGIDAKLKHRHPHVWGAAQLTEVGQVLTKWEELKRKEKEDSASLLEGIPRALPALQQAFTYGARVARVGFDWPGPAGVVEKVREEIEELEEAHTAKEREHELGDVLFAVANWARHLDIEPETALRQANTRFAARFRALEELARQRGQDLANMSIRELDGLWEEIKASQT